MPFTPNSTPLQFEYKPLGLERFAEPLAQMQKQYDITSTELQKPTYAIQSLSGSDEARSKHLTEYYDKQRDEIAANLIANRNARGTAKQIMELNQLHSSQPEILALQGNLQQYQAYAKEQKERVDKGKISEDEYKKNIGNALSVYENKKGLSYDHTTGNYNKLDFKSLSDDLRPEMDKQLAELTKMTKADKTAYANKLGIDLTSFTRSTGSGTHEFIKESDLDNILRGTIMSDPRYLKSIADRKELDLDYNKYNRPDLYQSEISNVIDLISKNPDSPIYHQLQNAISNGDQNMVEQIARHVSVSSHSSDYVNKMIDPYAKAGSYDAYTKSISEANLNKAHLASMGLGEDGAPSTPVAGWVPLKESTPFSVESLDASVSKTRESFKSLNENINTATNGAFGKVFPHGYGEGQYNYHQQASEMKDILRAYDRSGGNLEKFKKEYKGSANPDSLNRLFNSFKSEGTLTNFRNYAGSMAVNSNNLKTDEGIRKQALNNFKGTTEYKKGIQDIVKEMNDRYILLSEGIDAPDKPINIAKKNGFKTVEEALSKNPKIFDSGYKFVTDISLKELNNEGINKDLQTKSYISEWNIQGTDKAAKELKANTNTYLNQVVGKNGENLSSMMDATGTNISSNPEFEGGVKNGEATLARDSYGNVLIKVPYKTKDGKNTNLFVKPKKGSEFDGKMVNIAKEAYRSSSSQADQESSAELLFDMKHKNNPVNNFYIDPLETTNTKPVDVYKFTENGVQIKIVKESSKSSNTKVDSRAEENNQYFTAYAYQNGSWKPLTDNTGNVLKTTDVHKIKAELGAYYAK